MSDYSTYTKQQLRIELSDLNRNIWNARVHAIQDVYPDSGVYDPEDPRIDERENALYELWDGRRQEVYKLLNANNSMMRYDSERHADAFTQDE